VGGQEEEEVSGVKVRRGREELEMEKVTDR
jgi:hypothetical protein